MSTKTENMQLWSILKEVPDPEIPVINLVELGVIRSVALDSPTNTVSIIITPTYTGCPAKKLFEDLIHEKMAEKGFQKVVIKTQLNPAWTTDWLSEDTKKKLLVEGISPPTIGDRTIVCPNCGSANTKMISRFGSTPCQSLYSCNDCLEPFNYFKCH